MLPGSNRSIFVEGAADRRFTKKLFWPGKQWCSRFWGNLHPNILRLYSMCFLRSFAKCFRGLIFWIPLGQRSVILRSLRYPSKCNIEKWLKKTCGVHTARFLEYVWPFFNIMQERVNSKNIFINPLSASPIKWSHSNNLLAAADELFECVCPFCGVGA